MNRFKNILIGLLLLMAAVFAILFFLTRAKLLSMRPILVSTQAADSMHRQAFKIYRTRDSITIAEQQQAILTKDEAIKAGLLKEKDLKKYIAQVTLTNKEHVHITVGSKSKDTASGYIYHPTVPVRWMDSIPKGYAVVDTNRSHQVPREFFFEDKWFFLKGEDLKDTVDIPVISFRNKFTLTIGEKSMGFFRKAKPVVLIENENPYSEVIDMQNTVISQKIPWHRRRGLWIIAGLAAGVYLGKKL